MGLFLGFSLLNVLQKAMEKVPNGAKQTGGEQKM